ncbi:MAG: protein-L-isoaspartate(D-aspartate) O-methyltransferase [Epsilonproteobacteria bacterium]|nr:protein-L-isoaspartate(D-aspartate) O-methyltransferase [Campylobacterota bacterium]
MTDKHISKSVIEAVKKVDRGLFLPDLEKRYKDIDEPIPIGFNQTTSQPSLIALMIDLISPAKSMKILEIGSGCGYMSAILSQLVDKVYSIEKIPQLAKQAEENLKKANCKNVYIKVGSTLEEWNKKAPFDGIIVSAAAGKIPDQLLNQLAVGGKMVIPVGNTLNQKLMLIVKTTAGNEARFVTYCRFVPLVM